MLQGIWNKVLFPSKMIWGFGRSRFSSYTDYLRFELLTFNNTKRYNTIQNTWHSQTSNTIKGTPIVIIKDTPNDAQEEHLPVGL